MIQISQARVSQPFRPVLLQRFKGQIVGARATMGTCTSALAVFYLGASAVATKASHMMAIQRVLLAPLHRHLR
jgi:hypothetical protein